MRFRDAIDEAIASEYDPDYVPDDAEVTGNSTQWDCWNEGLDDAAVRAIVDASRRDECARGPLESAMALADALRVVGITIDPHQMVAEFLAELEAEFDPKEPTQQEPT